MAIASRFRAVHIQPLALLIDVIPKERKITPITTGFETRPSISLRHPCHRYRNLLALPSVHHEHLCAGVVIAVDDLSEVWTAFPFLFPNVLSDPLWQIIFIDRHSSRLSLLSLLYCVDESEDRDLVVRWVLFYDFPRFFTSDAQSPGFIEKLVEPLDTF
jgi:hypothetical protein